MHVQRNSCDLADSFVPHTLSFSLLSKSHPCGTHSPPPLHVRPDPAAREKTALTHALARCADQYKESQNSRGGANTSDANLASKSRPEGAAVAGNETKVLSTSSGTDVLLKQLQRLGRNRY